MTVFIPTVARVGFESNSVNVNEGSQFATLFVAVLGTTSLGGEVTLRFSTADITAANAARGDDKSISHFVVKYFFVIFHSTLIAGVDYATTVVSTLTFNPTTTRQLIRVPILQDRMVESTEQFRANLVLENNNGISVTVDPALATVNIIDNDSELRMYTYLVTSFCHCPCISPLSSFNQIGILTSNIAELYVRKPYQDNI